MLGSGQKLLPSDVGSRLARLYASFLAAPELEGARIGRSLSRLSQARRRRQLEDKILDLCIALEMVLLDDNKSADQLSMTFGLRGSLLVARTLDERRQLFQSLRELYTYRSQVSHTGVLCGGKANRKQQVEAAFPMYSALAGQIIHHLIINGRPNWTDLLLGATTRLQV